MPRRDFLRILFPFLERLKNANDGSAIGGGRLRDDRASDPIDRVGDTRSGLQDILDLVHDLLGPFERRTFGQLHVDEHDSLIGLRDEAGGNFSEHVSRQDQKPA